VVIQVVHKVRKMLILEKKFFLNLYKIQNNRVKTNNINVKYYHKFQLILSLLNLKQLKNLTKKQNNIFQSKY